MNPRGPVTAVELESVRNTRMVRVLQQAKSALMEAICIAGEQDRDQAARLIHLWAEVDREIEAERGR